MDLEIRARERGLRGGEPGLERRFAERAELLPGDDPLAVFHGDRPDRAADRERDISLLNRVECAHQI
jgi:hypothetical protein